MFDLLCLSAVILIIMDFVSNMMLCICCDDKQLYYK